MFILRCLQINLSRRLAQAKWQPTAIMNMSYKRKCDEMPFTFIKKNA